MEDKAVSIRAVCSVALWVIGIVLVLIDAFTEDISPGQVGLACIGGGAVLTMRGYFGAFLEHQRNAFELGRDYERAKSGEDRVRLIR